MQDLLEQLGATAEEIDLLDPQFIIDSIKSMDVSLARKTRMMLALPKRPLELNHARATKEELEPQTDLDLRSYFARQERRQREPWRASLEKMDALLESASSADFNALKTHFINSCKNELISAQDALASTYILFGTPESQRFYASIVAFPLELRVRYHNFYVARDHPQLLSVYGALIEKLQFPLFPACTELEALNLRLLTLTEGASSGKTPPSLYRQETFGSGYIPVLTAQDGTMGVDVTAIENAFAQVHRKLELLHTQITDLKGDPQRENLSKLIGSLRNTVLFAQNISTRKKHQPYNRQQRYTKGGQKENF